MISQQASENSDFLECAQYPFQFLLFVLIHFVYFFPFLFFIFFLLQIEVQVK